MINITSDNIDEVIEKDNILIMFGNAECKGCKFKKPLVERLAAMNIIKVGYCDVESEKWAFWEYNLLGVPTLLFFYKKNGRIEHTTMFEFAVSIEQFIELAHRVAYLYHRAKEQLKLF